MTKAQIEQKAKTYSKNYWYNTNNSVNVASIEKLLIDFAIKITEELQEENAELRRNEFNARSCLELQQSQDKAIVNYMGEQLTKAKELLKQWLSLCGFKVEKLSKDTEQFLSEVEK